MKNLAIIMCLGAVFWLAPLSAQKLSLSSDSSKQNTLANILTNLDNQPSFPGGQDSLIHFLQTNLHYPSLPRRKGVEGTVFVVFNIDSDGEILEPKVKFFRLRRVVEITDTSTNELKNVILPEKYDEDLEKEALRVVEAMPHWIPARYKNKPIKVPYTMPVRFKLE